MDKLSKVPNLDIFIKDQLYYMRGCKDGKHNALVKVASELHANAEMHEDGNYYLREEWIDEIIEKLRREDV